MFEKKTNFNYSRSIVYMKQLSKIIDYTKKHWQVTSLIFLCLLMILPYGYLARQGFDKFYSPDEMSNYLFTREFTEHSRLYFEEPLNPVVGNAIFPRSFNILGDRLVPQGFIGLPILLGLLAKLITLPNVFYFIPKISLLGVLLFYFILKRIFTKNIAWLSAVLLLFNSLYLYNGAHSFIAINLLIVTALAMMLCLLKYTETEKPVYVVLAGTLFSLAVWLRTSEIIWLGLIILIFYFQHYRNIKWKSIIIFCAIAITGLGGILLLNKSLFGNFFSVGYSNLQTTATEGTNQLLGFIKNLILPFGFDWNSWSRQTWAFFISQSWYLTIPGLLGLIYLLKNWSNQNSKQRFYLLAALITTAYLLVFYGSYWPWGQSGQYEGLLVSPGAPHNRYWLMPIILLIPLAVAFGAHLIKQLNLTSRRQLILITGLICLISFVGVTTAFTDPSDGLRKTTTDIRDFEPRLVSINKYLTGDAVLIVPAWADRVFYPEYRVIYSVEDALIHDATIYTKLAALQKLESLYYYSASSQADIDYLSTNYFEPHNLRLRFIAEIYKGENLYVVEKK